MKLVMCMLVRDEADVLADQLAYHFAAGVDFVVATDHRSVDGTTDILEGYAREGRLHLIREESELVRADECRNGMAQLAATEFGADWVIPSDGDEFWWPRGGTLKELLAAVPPRFGVIHTLSQKFPYRPGDGPFAERMTVRLSPHAALNDANGPYHVDAKLVMRPERHVPVRGWYSIEVLRFPVRTRDQCERKLGAAGMAKESAGLDEWLARWAIDDEDVARGLREGWLREDLRLRDALRRLREHDSLPAFHALLPAEPSLVDDLSRLGDADPVVRATARVDSLESRLLALEDALAVPRAVRRLRDSRAGR